MRYLLFFCLGFLLIACERPARGRNGIVYRSAKDYNNYIIERQKQISDLITNFYDHVFSNQDSAGNFLSEGRKRAKITLDEISGMPPFRGDSSFRNAAIRSFTFYKELFEHEYPQMIALRQGKATMNDEDKLALQEISGKIITDEERFDKDLHNTQKDFAEKNHMRLIGEKE